MKECTGIIMPCRNGCMKAGYAYVPPQDVKRFFDYQSAFACGTIFPDLCLPQGKYGPNETFR